MENEQKTFSKYVLDRADTKLSDGCIRKYYYCHRSYTHRKTKDEIKKTRETKSIGSNKINGTCPSMIKLTILENERAVNVEFWENHFGHELEIGRIGLDNDTKLNIAGIYTNYDFYFGLLHNLNVTINNCTQLFYIFLFQRN